MALLCGRCRSIFQDPYASLNPRLTVGKAIAEPLVAHGLASRTEAENVFLALLRVVGLAPFPATAIRTSSRAVSASAWGSPGHW